MKDSNANLVSQLVDSHHSPWPAMEHYQERNERQIRQSIETTNKKEKEDRIKQGLTPPAARQTKTQKRIKSQKVQEPKHELDKRDIPRPPPTPRTTEKNAVKIQSK